MFNPLNWIPAPWLIWLRIALYVACFAAGAWVTHKFHQADEVRAVNAARVAEHEIVLWGNDVEKGVLDRARDRRERANNELDDLRARLARAPGCPVPVPPSWLRKPRPVPGTPADSPGARPTPAPVDTPAGGPTADARDVVFTCERNRLEVAEPEADEREALRAWYEGVRRRYNGR